MENKKHWYDGWFYDKIIAPNQEGLFSRINELIEDQSCIIDIGCGTGRLAFKLAAKCKFVKGIDLSEKNIKRADQASIKHPNKNVSFLHSGLSEYFAESKERFDYAILSFVIHEVTEAERIRIINEAAIIADKIIISDHFPETTNNAKIIRGIIEFLAGSEHYRNFKSFIKNGGTEPLANLGGLKVIHKEFYRSHLQIVILQSNHLVK